MSDSCFKKNDLLIPGTRQDQRLYKALDPSYVLPDERTVANLLVFITKYAELINFYALKGPEQKDYTIDGNWQPLILSDEAFNYAGISVTPYSLPNITFYRYINLYETGSTTAKRNAAYLVLWDIIFSVYKEIDAFYTALPVYMPLRNEIATEISNGLVTDFGIVAGAYLNDAAAIPSLNLQVATPNSDDEYKFGFANDIIHTSFHKLWIDTTLAPGANSWTDYLAVLDPNPGLALTFFNAAGLVNDFDRIDYSTLQLKQVFKRAFEAYARIIAKANDFLQNSLENNSAHYAHHGLMLAFLKLFAILRNDINEFTRKHLEYYYSRVLQIHPAPAVPDSAHIIFDPAKNISSHLIEKTTALNAGKDGTGKILLYNTDDEIVINQAKVAHLKTLFVKPANVAGAIEKITASPVANSVDGNGAPFTGDDTSWKGFGNELNDAGIGFYIASPVLHLTEGTRFIDFKFFTDAAGIAKMNVLAKPDIFQFFTFAFSGEKQWEELIINDGIVTDYNSELSFTPPALLDTSFTIRLTLLPQFKPVVGYDPLVCDGNLETIFPVARFVLNQSAAGAYEKLKDIEISKINITTTVEDIAALSLQNEIGVLDPVKPVQAFGPLPKIGTSFLVGHHELIHKEITSLRLSLNWLDLPSLPTHYSYLVPDPDPPAAPTGTKTRKYVNVSAMSAFTAAVEFIRNKGWVVLGAASEIFPALNKLEYLSISNIKKPLKRPENYTNIPITFETGTTDGFIRFTLKTPVEAFGHSKWSLVFASQTVALTQDAAHNTLPNPPYTPLLESIKLKYIATQDINLGSSYKAEQGQFIHLLPFGIKPTHSNALLLPTFELQKKQPDGTFSYELLESALLIGISNAVINQNISLLLQMNDGTEDISVDPPPIIWNYLSTEGWKNFDTLLLGDSTGNLLKSGIVKFQVPADVDFQTL
jgi:hypothetical protein